MIERIAQFLTEWTGSPVSNGAAAGAVVIAVGSVIAFFLACVWFKSGQKDMEAAEAERKRLEAEARDNER